MANGHTKARPKMATLKAAGYWIRSAPHRNGERRLYWWQTKDESGDDQWSAAAAETDALQHLAEVVVAPYRAAA